MGVESVRALPRVTVATVVEQGGRFLFVEERIGGRLVLNQPAGHLDPGEPLIAAAERETLEETAWHVRVTRWLGVQQYCVDDKHFIRFHFAAEALLHEAHRTLDEGIERALWLSLEELEQQSTRMRSPMVKQSLLDYLSPIALPFEALRWL
jgi:ADP-ribose pyrophosphatase YjhB (NUDIX family)